jgi:hypothetical protein
MVWIFPMKPTRDVEVDSTVSVFTENPWYFLYFFFMQTEPQTYLLLAWGMAAFHVSIT